MEYPDCHVDDEMECGNFDVGFHVEGTDLEGFQSIPMFSSSISLLVYEGHPLTEKDIRPNIIFNTSGFSLCHKLCRQKKALSIVVDRISQDMESMHLKKIPFEQPLEWSVSMIYKKEFEQNRLIRIFRDYTLDYLKNI